MKIGYLDGFRLKQAIIAGSRIIDNMQKHLNMINVFPVPDGDTGTNMATTMNHITKNLSQCSHRAIGEVSLVLAESALLGAQGNSGVILAQFFNGFAEALEGKLRIKTALFAEAVRKAKEASIKAMSNPKEGTILTVIKDWANKVEELSTKHSDFVEIFQKSLKTAKISLAETPKKLKVLANAGVVDAGAQGFVHLLEGITHFIEKGKITILEKKDVTDDSPILKIEPEITFQYCTECVFRSDQTDRQQLLTLFKELGDSLIVANKGDLYRIHIHTNEPGQIFKQVAIIGTIEKKKVDDMAAQHEHLLATRRFAIITDSACDLPYHFLQKNKIFVVPTKLSFGPKTYLDKIEITPIEFYDKLIHSEFHPTTSQPSLSWYKKIYEEVADQYEAAISVHLPDAASGTFQAAVNSAETFGKNKITCLDGKTVSVALGLIVMEAVEAINAGESFEQVIEKTKYAIDNTFIFISIANLDYAVRGGRVSKPKWLFSKTFNIKPVLTFNKTGKIQTAGKAIGDKNTMKKTLKLVFKNSRKYKQVKFMVAHANAYSKAIWYVEQLKKKYEITEEIPIIDAAPVLGVHAGPGTAAIAFIGYE